MNSFSKSFLFVVIKIAAFLFMLLPIGLDLWIGRCLGFIGYFFLHRKRQVVYANLKTLFSSTHSPSQIRLMTKDVFINFIQSAVELLCLPKIKRLGFDKFVELEGKENIDKARDQGKGVVFLAIHSGSWELASVVGGIIKGAYHVVANEQSKLPQLDHMLNTYRTIAGAHVIIAGVDTKEIIRSLQKNEIISLVIDQGGKTGLAVPFFGKTASMSTGAMRLALKYGAAVCPVWIERKNNGKHRLVVFEPMAITRTNDFEDDIRVNVIKAANHFESLLRSHPVEYMWFYKVFKYSSQKKILIIDDGRTGHLRQSQAVSRHLSEILNRKEKSVDESIVSLEWRSPRAASLFSIYVFISQYLAFLRREDCLKLFLTDESFRNLMRIKADFVVSCGSQGAGINYILSQNHLAKSISILTPGLLSMERFNAVVMPQHDKIPHLKRARLISTKVSPNLINPAYLKSQAQGLMKYYSHLKTNVRMKFGVLIGGDTKGVKFDESKLHELMSQIKDAALHYNADILLSTSRRTPAGIEQVILKELKNFERCALCIIANQRNVPEAVGGILGLSDLVIVSGESISMVSEALSSGRRTIVFSPQGEYKNIARDKYDDFVLKLNDQGYLMVSSVDDIKLKIKQLLNQKIMFKSLNDNDAIKKGLEQIL